MNGVELLRLRNKMKLSRQQMAEAIGCSVGALRNWELGYYDVPKYIALGMYCVCDELATLWNKGKIRLIQILLFQLLQRQFPAAPIQKLTK